MKENKEEFLREEWEKEADRIIAEVENAPELSEIKVTEEMDQNLMQKIKEYEREKALENLSEEDREAIRLGRKLQAKRKRRTPRKYIAVAAVAIMVMAFGVTSMGGPERIVTMVKQMVAGRENVIVESEDEERPDNGTYDEDVVYEQIKEELGFDAVRPVILPEGTEFVKGEVFKEYQSARIIYELNKKTILYEIEANYSNSSFGYDVEDQLLNEYMVELSDANVQVKEYAIEGAKEIQRVAVFEHKNVRYIINGIIEKEDFERILKNLHFF